MWEKQDKGGGIHDAGNTYTWDEAFSVHVAGLNAVNFAGHDDWRLPNVKELQSIVDYGTNLPSVSTAFNVGCALACTLEDCSCTGANSYWSSTTDAANVFAAWGIAFGDGIMSELTKGATYGVRAVRGISTCLPATGQTTCWDSVGNTVVCAGTGQDGDLQTGPSLSFMDNGDGTITDLNTGLLWEKLGADGGIHDLSNGGTWDTAFTHAAMLNSVSFAGETDWRIPNAKELLTIINFEEANPAVSAVFWSGCLLNCVPTSCSCTSLSPYWSSTTLSRTPAAALAVRFDSGRATGISKGFDPGWIRAVRGQP
jgi:hypothetical protein